MVPDFDDVFLFHLHRSVRTNQFLGRRAFHLEMTRRTSTCHGDPGNRCRAFYARVNQPNLVNRADRLRMDDYGR